MMRRVPDLPSWGLSRRLGAPLMGPPRSLEKEGWDLGGHAELITADNDAVLWLRMLK